MHTDGYDAGPSRMIARGPSGRGGVMICYRVGPPKRTKLVIIGGNYRLTMVDGRHILFIELIN
jgi:hypothetical protein